MTRILMALVIAATYFTSAQAVECENEVNVPYGTWTGEYSDLVNGYCFEGYWIPGIITNSFYWMPPPQHFYTRALYQSETYDTGEDYIALMSPITAGWSAFIRMPNSDEWIPVTVGDVVKREHYDFHVIYNQSGLEFSYGLAERLGVIDWVNEDGSRYPYGVEVCIANENPEELCGGEALSFQDWYLENARFVGDLTRSNALANN